MNDTLMAVINELTNRIVQEQSDDEMQRVLKEVVKEAMHEIEAEQDPEQRADWRGLSGKIALVATGVALGRKFATYESGHEGTAVGIRDGADDEESGYEDLTGIADDEDDADTDTSADTESDSGGHSLPLVLLVAVLAAVAYMLFRRRSESIETTLDDWEDPLSEKSSEDNDSESGLTQGDGNESDGAQGTDETAGGESDSEDSTDIGSRGDEASPVEGEEEEDEGEGLRAAREGEEEG